MRGLHLWGFVQRQILGRKELKRKYLVILRNSCLIGCIITMITTFIEFPKYAKITNNLVEYIYFERVYRFVILITPLFMLFFMLLGVSAIFQSSIENYDEEKLLEDNSEIEE
jgi:hypothetical protein